MLCLWSHQKCHETRICTRMISWLRLKASSVMMIKQIVYRATNCHNGNDCMTAHATETKKKLFIFLQFSLWSVDRICSFTCCKERAPEASTFSKGKQNLWKWKGNENEHILETCTSPSWILLCAASVLTIKSKEKDKSKQFAPNKNPRQKIKSEKARNEMQGVKETHKSE